ncbi:alpha/beta hydrolase [Ideonella dechloratans]|uniref:Alpha/beta hydrolase n=1 Tax=Ideonella dechloratans TaxID=36863 RepID=A0A643FCY7_IDEDE|nr:alpha/beta fold hydrolase [Ideonella dechloratans]KAB0583234.1 alpha/beta hydrolase [Ideonella dechloratans]UFU10582.1 alpha/beta hydrolase [Ideonella dechloratans]
MAGLNPQSQLLTIAGPAGPLELAIDAPPDMAPRGVVVVCHPHPLHGGTMDNKVVQTLARAFLQLGYRVARFNFRGVGASAGQYDEGRGEVDDALAVIAAVRDPALSLALAGFSFGAYVAAAAAVRLPADQAAERLALVGPATSRFPVPPVPADTLVIHGETDDVVPLQATLDWARPQVLPVVVVPGVGHFFHGQLSVLKSLVTGAWHR